MEIIALDAHKTKLMLGSINKTDKLDARGLNKLQRTGTLPTVCLTNDTLSEMTDGYKSYSDRYLISISVTKLRVQSILPAFHKLFHPGRSHFRCFYPGTVEPDMLL